jgi:hypothetical protein
MGTRTHELSPRHLDYFEKQKISVLSTACGGFWLHLAAPAPVDSFMHALSAFQVFVFHSRTHKETIRYLVVIKIYRLPTCVNGLSRSTCVNGHSLSGSVCRRAPHMYPDSRGALVCERSHRSGQNNITGSKEGVEACANRHGRLPSTWVSVRRSADHGVGTGEAPKLQRRRAQ